MSRRYLSQLVSIRHVENVSRLRAAERDRRLHGEQSVLRRRRPEVRQWKTTNNSRSESHSIRAYGTPRRETLLQYLRIRRPVAHLPCRLHDWLEMAAGVRDETSEWPDSRVPDSIQRARKTVAELLEGDRFAWKPASGSAFVGETRRDDELPGGLRRVSYEPTAHREGRRL